MENIARQQFPLCCKAQILSGFPQGDRLFYRNDVPANILKGAVKKEMGKAKAAGNSTLVVILTEEQKTAANVLHDLGWRHGVWMNKSRKRGKKKLRVWYYDI